MDSVAWSPDGQYLAGASYNTIIIWETETWQPTQRLIGHERNINSVAWSQDGQLASGSDWPNSSIIIWDLDSGQPRLIIKEHQSSVLDVAWSLDGRLASIELGAVYIWDLDTGQPVHFIQEQLPISSMAWSPDDLMAIGGDSEGIDAVQIWQMDPEKWTARICQKVGRNLSESEWNRFLDWTGPYDPIYKTCPQWPTNPEYLNRLLDEAYDLTMAGNVDEAVAHYEQAIEFDPSLDFDPEEKVTTDLITYGELSVYQNSVDEAITAYRNAQKIEDKHQISINSWLILCWYGTLHGRAEDVMFACDQMVSLNPNDGNLREGRSVARALTGDFDGAIEDLTFFLSWASTDEAIQMGWTAEEIQLREEWLKTLEAGQNPIDEDTIFNLWYE